MRIGVREVAMVSLVGSDTLRLEAGERAPAGTVTLVFTVGSDL